jgi:hypothetical protein
MEGKTGFCSGGFTVRVRFSNLLPKQTDKRQALIKTNWRDK